MASRGNCPLCGYAFTRDKELAETRGKCPNCGMMLEIPGPAESPGKQRAKPSPPPAMPRPGPPAPKPVPPPEAETPPSGGVVSSASPVPATPPASGGATPPPLPPQGRVVAGSRALGLPLWGWITLAGIVLAAIVGVGLYVAFGPTSRSDVLAEGRSPKELTVTATRAATAETAARDNARAKKAPSTEKPGDQKPPEGDPGTQTEKPAEAPAVSPPTQPKVAKSLEEVLEAIVKFEVPVAGEARMQYGCGFLVDGRGWIATNHHLVANATTAARATFSDGTTCKLAGLVARRPEHDLAIVKLEDPPPELTILDISYDETPRLGSQVYAFGHPYNAEFSLSKGIVSRVLTTADLVSSSQPQVLAAMNAPEDLVWIQHDAKISPGNSGGPLLEEDGRVVGINTFVNVKAEFGYASHVKYLRQLVATASDEATPLPPAQPEAQTLGEGQTQVRPGQVVVSAGRIKQLFDAGRAFAWTPQQPEQYETLAELAKLMTLAKHLQAIPQAVRAPPEAVANLVGFTDQVFFQMRSGGWGPNQSKAINQYAADRVDKAGEGTMLYTTVVGSVRGALLLQIQGTDKHVLVPVGGVLSKSPRGTNWLVIGLVSPQTAQIKTPTQPERQRLPIVLTHYMLKVP